MHFYFFMPHSDLVNLHFSTAVNRAVNRPTLGISPSYSFGHTHLSTTSSRRKLETKSQVKSISTCINRYTSLTKKIC